MRVADFVEQLQRLNALFLQLPREIAVIARQRRDFALQLRFCRAFGLQLLPQRFRFALQLCARFMRLIQSRLHARCVLVRLTRRLDEIRELRFKFVALLRDRRIA